MYLDFQKLKERKENNIPSAMLNNDEPARKRSKLVLPEPQISDHEMEQIVKLGKASEAARESVADGDGASQRASATLLADYSVTPGNNNTSTIDFLRTVYLTGLKMKSMT